MTEVAGAEAPQEPEAVTEEVAAPEVVSPEVEAVAPAPVEAAEEPVSATAVTETPDEPETVQSMPPEAADDVYALIITPDGAGRIFKGQIIEGIEQTFDAGDHVSLPADIAEEHIANGYATKA